MSKRSEQTTGMPRSRSDKPTGATEGSAGARKGPRLLGEVRTRHEREAAIQRLLVYGTAAVGALAVLLVLVAIIYDQLIVPGQPVATVNGQNITVGDFERRVRLERIILNEQINQGYAQLLNFGFDAQQAQQQLTQFPPYDDYINEMSVPDQLGNRVLNDMVEDVLVRQQAQALGITVNQEQVQEQIRTFFGYDPNEGLVTPTASPSPTASATPFITATPSPVPTMTPTPAPTATDAATATPSVTPLPSATPSATPEAATREAVFNTTRQDFFRFVTTAGRVSDADLNAYFEVRALRNALRDQLTADLAHTTTFASVRHILVPTQEQAQDVLESLQAGESFVDLAAAVSQDTGNSGVGGELGWSPLTRYVEEFANAVRDAEIGAFVGPVQTEFGFHIIQVRGREEREMSDDEYAQAKERFLIDWIADTREQQAANIQTFDVWVDNVPTDPPLSLRSP